MDESVLLWIVIGFIPMVFWLSYLIYLKIEKRGTIPEIKHPYTGRKKYTLYFEFTRMVFFVFILLFAIFYYKNAWFIGLGMIFLVVQWMAMKMKMEEIGRFPNEIEIEYTEAEREEAASYFNQHPRLRKKNIAVWRKVVMNEDVIYFSRFRRLFLKDRMYRYIYLNQARKVDNHIVFDYGFMGMPLFSRYLFITKQNKKKADKMLKSIEKIREKKKSRLENFLIKRAYERADKWSQKFKNK